MATKGRLAVSFLTAALASGALLAAVPQTGAAHTPVTRTMEPTIREIDDRDRVVVQGNVHAALSDAMVVGHTDPAMRMESMILSLRISPEAQTRLQRLLEDQQNPTSPNFHKWLTPEEFGQQFGPSQENINVVTNWLQDQGFTVDQVAPGRTTINFSGTRDQVEWAFRTAIMDYQINGEIRHANASDPTIPRALANIVHGVVSLHNIPRQSYNAGFHKLSAEDADAVAMKARGITPDWHGTANGTSGTYTSPTDWATIYNAAASYSANGNGAGAIIGIVGRTNPGTANWATFRSTLGLPVNTPTIIINGTNPGDAGAAEDGEADLDAEWSGGVAPGATVKFVASKSTSTTDGVDLSAQYIVNNNIADVMSTSFGQCESSMGTTENNFYNNLWSQAASQGITSCVSTGDSGAAGCDGGSATTGTGAAVNGLASTPFNVAVGATQLSTSSSYWNASGAATGYIPETPWNESGTVSGGSGLWSTSSGASTLYAKPSWQVAPGVPSASHRYLPDVSLDGSDMFFGNYGMLVYSQGAMATTGGTSAASPSFAGVMALVVQKYGRQGNANTKLYQLGQAQYGSAGTAVFHDITSGNNNVPGTTGFSAGTGWDEVTGLGTIDVNALVNNWGGSTTTAPAITTQPANVTVTAPATATFSVVASGTAPLTYQWFKGTTSITGATAASYTTPATSSADNGTTFHVTVTNSAGSATSNNATLTVSSTPTAPAITSQPANATVNAGSAATFTVTASGTAPMTYQWYKGTAAISGATASSYTTPATVAADNGTTFHVVVTNSVGSATSNNATLTVTTVSGGTFLEVESNNTIGTANAVAASYTAIQGNLTVATDVDYFALGLAAGQKVTINMTGPSGVDWDLYLKNSAGTTLTSSTGSTTTESVTYTNTGASAITVYPEVIVYNGVSSTPYNLALSYVTPPPSVTYNEVEPNNSLAAANAVPDTATKIVGYISSSTDNDYFAVHVGAGKTLAVGMTGPTGSSYDYDLYFYNASGTTLASSTGSTTTENASWKNTGTATVTVYVAVKRYAGSSTTIPYNLTLSR